MTLFLQRVVKPFYLGQSPDRERIARAVTEEIPALLSELAARLAGRDWLAGPFSLADIAVGSWVRAGLLAGFALDRPGSPEVADWTDRLFAHPAFAEPLATETTSDHGRWIAELPPLADHSAGT